MATLARRRLVAQRACTTPVAGRRELEERLRDYGDAPEPIERVHLPIRQELPEPKPSWLPEILDLIGWSAAAGAAR